MSKATEKTGLLSIVNDDAAVDSADDPTLKFEDDPSEVSFVRKLMLYLAKNDDDDSNKPSMLKAWAYFEHVTLPRYFVRSKQVKGEYEKAEPGELKEPTLLYPVWDTPEKDLGDFGIGIGIYFWTLKCLALILLLGGIINIPVLEYYSSVAYSKNNLEGHNWFLRASAICTENEWAACPTCTADDWDGRPLSAKSVDSYAATADGKHHFIYVNKCGEVTITQGVFSFLALLVVILAIFLMERHGKRTEIILDEEVQTVSDYSVQVENPPRDEGYDPEDWKSFFSQFGTVAAVTVAVDNEDLTRVLLERRSYLKLLCDRLPANFKYNKHVLKPVVDAAYALTWYEKLMMSDHPEGLLTKINELDKNIKDMVKARYDVSQVFVTFETEEAQRNALSKLDISRLNSLRNNTSAVPEEYLFRGKHLLLLSEPADPSSIRWTDLDESFLTRWKAGLFTSFLMVLFVLFDVVVINACFNNLGASATGLAVTFMNTASFYVITFFISYEYHTCEGEKDSSMYSKANIFSVINTIGITAFLTPFSETLSDKNGSIINALYAIYFYAIIKGPIIQILDPMSNFYKFVLAPRAPDQRRMNSYFKGAYWDLSQRYTEMTIMVFLTMYYAVLFPSGYLLGSFALAVQYWTDKYCLLRLWAKKPALGNQTSENSRFFLNIMIIFFATFSAYAFSTFPYDNACNEDTNVPSSYVGDFTAFDIGKTKVEISITTEDTTYKFCDQDMLGSVLTSFPPFPSWQTAGEEWMTSDQEVISTLFGWTSIVVTLLVFLNLYLKLKSGVVKRFFFKTYKPDGVASTTRFSELKEVRLYIPQERVYGNIFPLLLIDTSEISSEYVGWTDPYNDHEFHNVIFNVRFLADMLGSPHVDEKKMFGAFKRWPPTCE